MVVDEDADARFRIPASRQTLAQPLNDGGEGMLLNEIQQLLFGLEIIVETGQRDAAQARQIAHGSAFITFFGKDLGCVVENLGQTAVEAGVEGPGCRGSRHRDKGDGDKAIGKFERSF